MSAVSVSQAVSQSSEHNVCLAVDAMGGDFGVESAIPGCAAALGKSADIKFLLFGDAAHITPVLKKYPRLEKVSELIHTDKRIHSEEKPSAALRKSKGTSMRLAIEAVKEGRAQAVVSGGNTGALMALSKLVLKPLPGIHRPAIASVFPTLNTPTIMLDLGANVLVDAENLVQFAVLGAAFARVYRQDKPVPSVGLLNVGSEDMKGPDHVRAAASMLSDLDFSGHYHGFVEGDDITKGVVDVIVTDGYAGNIALKAAEGVGRLSNHLFKQAIRSGPLAMIGGMLAYVALKRFYRKIDPRCYNGGVFLGLNGICVKSHGGSDPFAFSNAVSLALNMARQDYIERVAGDIRSLVDQGAF